MKIPIIQANEPLEQIPVTATTKGAGRAWGAVEQLSGQVQAISLDIAETQRKIRMGRELAQGEIDMEAISADISNNLRKTADPDTYYQQWGEQFQEAANKRLEGVKGVRTRAAMETLFSNIGARELRKEKDYANKLWVDTEKAKRGEILINYANNNKYDEGIKLIELTKNLDSPTENLKLREDFKKMIEEGRLINLYKNDPPGAILAIKRGEFPSLNPKELAIYESAAAEREVVLRNRLEKERDEKLVDDTYKELKGKFPNDYPLMPKRLYDTDYQKEKGITGPLSNQVENLLKSEWSTIETERAKKHEANSANLFVNLRKTSPGEIDGMVKTDQISWQQGEHFKLELQKTDAVEDDPATYTILLSKVMDPTLTDEKKPKIAMDIITSRGLKTETKKSLIKDLLEDQLFKDPWFKRAEKEIKEGLGWTEQMGFFNLKDPLKGLTSYRDVTNQLIKDIKKEGLRDENIYNRAKKLVLPKQMEVWDMLMGGGKGKEEKPKEKHEIGKIYTNAQGEKAKYIGNGKWESQKPPK